MAIDDKDTKERVNCSSIDEIVGKLSPEERKFHKELIDECSQNEKEITKNSAQAYKNFVEAIKIYQEEIIPGLNKISESINYIKEGCSKIQITQAYKERKKYNIQ